MVRAKKSLSQNFLVDPNLQRKIVDALEASTDDEVLEIGPGTGALTRLIAPRVRRLVVVELDTQLAESLAREFEDHPGVRVVHGDILKVDLGALGLAWPTTRVLGNLPYHITTPLLFRLLEREHRPAVMVVMVQREVADRILAAPGTSEYGALSVGVRTVARAERLFHVGRQAFRPVPNVESTVLRITPIRPSPLSPSEEEAVRTLTRATFGWRRKQLRTTLRQTAEYGLDDAALDLIQEATGIHLERRPETLDPGEFVTLARALERDAR